MTRFLIHMLSRGHGFNTLKPPAYTARTHWQSEPRSDSPTGVSDSIRQNSDSSDSPTVIPTVHSNSNFMAPCSRTVCHCLPQVRQSDRPSDSPTVRPTARPAVQQSDSADRTGTHGCGFNAEAMGRHAGGHSETEQAVSLTHSLWQYKSGALHGFMVLGSSDDRWIVSKL